MGSVIAAFDINQHEMIKVRSHGAAAAAIFLPQQMGCIGFNVSVHTAAAAATVLQGNGFGTQFVLLQQRHHEGSPDSGTSKSLNFSNFLTFLRLDCNLFVVRNELCGI